MMSNMRELHLAKSKAMAALNACKSETEAGISDDERFARSLANRDAWRVYTEAAEAVIRAEKGQKPRLKFYTIFQKWPDENELFTVEGPMLKTVEDVLRAIPEYNHVAKIFHGEEDVTTDILTLMEAKEAAE